ncbi:hypothetical protein M3Y94_00502700 [Aphelenchoides besseyi]|nr:hypothetical protein M3Y94_00502700 [Aphelenchoides besseyi]
MPVLEIQTNLSKSKIPANFLAKATTKIATLTGKPESYAQVVVLADQLVSFGGNSTDPAAAVRFTSIGKVSGPEVTAPLVSDLTDFISAELGIPKDRLV